MTCALRMQFVVVLCCLACGIPTRAQETPPPPVYSAVAENQIFEAAPQIVYFDLVNVGSKTITAYMAGLFCTASDGVEHYRGSGGQDMIEASDPFPGSIAAKKPADVWGWIEPQSRKRTGHNIFGCMEEKAIGARVNVEMVLFEDGSGEGNERLQKSMLETRKSRSQEMQRWVGRFGELRQAADLPMAARRLYQDLVAANRQSEEDPDAASSNAMKSARAVRRQLQDLALEITQFAKTHKQLDEEPYMQWRMSDLEKRSEHLQRGAGPRE